MEINFEQLAFKIRELNFIENEGSPIGTTNASELLSRMVEYISLQDGEVSGWNDETDAIEDLHPNTVLILTTLKKYGILNIGKVSPIETVVQNTETVSKTKTSKKPRQILKS